MGDRKQVVIDTVKDLASVFMYYDRKEDEDLSREDLLRSIAEGETTIKEIASIFEKELRDSLKRDAK